MPSYKAPTDELDFVLFELFDAESLWSSMAPFAGVNRELARAILEAAAKLAEQEFFPLNQTGDAEGPRWDDGHVHTPPGFRQAYEAFTRGGWLGIAGEQEYGGQGMPKMLTVAWEEMFYAANTGLFLYTTLTAGACILLAAHASEDIKRMCLPRLYEGRWSATMDLTESQAGSDLGIITTKAEPRGDGSFAVTGSKMFITSGEHDLTENILHLVLAKLPDAPPGSRGISLFLVPKFLINDDGTLGERNGVVSGSIEHKMGIRGSATSVMNYDGATGYLIGEENRGLAPMFTMMNYERLSIGIQGLGIAEVAYQNARDYARARLQGRAPGERPERPGGQNVARGDAVQSGGYDQYEAELVDEGSHAVLGLDHVGDHVRERAVISYRAGQHVVDSVLETTIHDAAGEDALVDRFGDAAAATNGVDGSNVVLVAGIDGQGSLQVYAQRSAKEGLFDVMGRQGVAGEQNLNVPRLDQSYDMSARPGVNDRRPADQQDLLARSFDFPHPLGDLADEHVLGLLGRDRG